jgi:hypothetical protein
MKTPIAPEKPSLDYARHYYRYQTRERVSWDQWVEGGNIASQSSKRYQRFAFSILGLATVGGIIIKLMMIFPR